MTKKLLNENKKKNKKTMN